MSRTCSRAATPVLWSVSNGHYIGLPPAGGIASSLIDMGATISSSSYLELTTTLSTTGRAGLMFDTYSATDYKFVALDVAAGRVVIGHASPRGGLVTDVSIARTLIANTTDSLQLIIKGLTPSVVVDGQFVASFAFNGIGVDGDFGLAVWSGIGSFDSIRIRTNDPAFPEGSTGPIITAPPPAPITGPGP